MDTQTQPASQLSADQLARLVDISLTLNSTLETKILLQNIIQGAAELLDCEAASILLYDEQRGQLFFTTATGSDPNQLAEIPVPLEGSIAGAVFRNNRPLVIPDVQSDPRHYASVSQQVHFTPRMLLAVPMRIHDQVTGVLEALNKHQGGFTGQDVHLLSVIASQAAVAIHNARLVQALQKAYNELSRVDKLKSDFMAIASHELRTPLGVILGYATFLKEDAKGESSEHASIVLNSALRMRALVEDLTNLTLLHMGGVQLELQPLPIQQPLAAALAEIAATAQVKNQTLTHSLPSEPLQVLGDAAKLERLFANLLNNAIRFTPDGGRIHVRASAAHHEVRVDIQDNGVGIPPAELDNIFKEFYQVEDHMRRRHGGMGLGLAIARGLVRLHNGHIWAESAGENQGTTLHVVLPQTS